MAQGATPAAPPTPRPSGRSVPGPSGANNGMPLPLRIALWGDLVDFLDTGRRGI